MNEYDKQAQDFLKKTGATIEVKYKGLLNHFDDKVLRDTWTIKLARGNRSYSFAFGSSINDTEKRIKRLVHSLRPEQVLKGHTPNWQEKRKITDWTLEASEWKKAGEGDRPTAYSILAGISGSEPSDNIDDFADEYGFTKPSQAIKVFEAVKEEWTALCTLFNDEELNMLTEIA